MKTEPWFWMGTLHQLLLMDLIFYYHLHYYISEKKWKGVHHYISEPKATSWNYLFCWNDQSFLKADRGTELLNKAGEKNKKGNKKTTALMILCLVMGSVRVDEEGRHKEWQLWVLPLRAFPASSHTAVDEWVPSEFPGGWAERGLTSISAPCSLALISDTELWRSLTHFTRWVLRNSHHRFIQPKWIYMLKLWASCSICFSAFDISQSRMFFYWCCCFVLHALYLVSAPLPSFI